MVVFLVLAVLWVALIASGRHRVLRALARPVVEPADVRWTALDDRQVARLLDEAGQ